jgi:spermidine synthase
VSARLEELDWRQTPMGELTLRRRREPTLDLDVYEVKLGDEFLMSSLFTVAEVELARLGLAAVPGSALNVVVGGLGLGYTAHAVLEDPRVAHLLVVEAQPAVIEWHRRHLLPVAASLTADPRCELVEADFFAAVAGAGFGRGAPARWDAILVDIDHTPHHLLHPSHASFYTAAGLTALADRLSPGGVFGLWSDDPPDAEFVSLLEGVLDVVSAEVVTFANHYTLGPSANTVYLARTAGATP